MEDLLIATLEKLGYPIFRQGSLLKDEPYPDHFFTFWNNYTNGNGFYDNEDTQTIWDYDLNFYSIDPNETHSKLLDAKRLLKNVGFIAIGKGHDIASDELTHTGRGIHLMYMQNNLN